MTRLLLAALIAAIMFPGTAEAAFTDDFSAFNAKRWAVGEHQLGRSALAAANVSVGNGALTLALPGATTDGAEIRSTGAFTSGTASARLTVPDAPSSITGFFLYAPPDYASEIDIELYNDPSGTVMLSTYAGGSQTHTETRALGFDPTAAPHDYEIKWGAGKVTFRVDGVTLRTWTTGVPTAPMNLFANAWFPAWLGGLAPAETRGAVVEQIRTP
jgi:endo-1,3-1,4-beta-glycanase ExoK